VATKYRVSVSFDLVTEIEPEGIDTRIDSAVQDLDNVEDFESSTYFSTQTVTCDGGDFALTIEASDESHAEELVRNVFDDGNEFEDYNGFTWVVESVSFDVEALEWEPTVGEAIEVLKDFVNSHIHEGTEEGQGRVAKAAQVVLDDHTRLSERVTSLEARLDECTHRIDGLVKEVADLRTSTTP